MLCVVLESIPRSQEVVRHKTTAVPSAGSVFHSYEKHCELDAKEKGIRYL